MIARAVIGHEAADLCVCCVYAYLCNDSTQATLQLTNDSTEYGEVINELCGVHIHGIIVQLLELLGSCLEVGEDLLHTVGQCLALHSNNITFKLGSLSTSSQA